MSTLLSRQIQNTHNQIATLSNGVIANLSYEDDRWHFNGKPMTDSEINELRSLFLFMDLTLDDARSALGFC
jgi:hypothetical protein